MTFRNIVHPPKIMSHATKCITLRETWACWTQSILVKGRREQSLAGRHSAKRLWNVIGFLGGNWGSSCRTMITVVFPDQDTSNKMEMHKECHRRLIIIVVEKRTEKWVVQFGVWPSQLLFFFSLRLVLVISWGWVAEGEMQLVHLKITLLW